METIITVLGTLAGVLLGWFLRHFLPWSCEQKPQLIIKVNLIPVAGPVNKGRIYKIVNIGVFSAIVTDVLIDDKQEKVAIALSPGEEKDLPLPGGPNRLIKLKARCPKGHIHKLTLERWKDGNYYPVK